MTKLRYLIARNCKLFFKDKGVFLTALIAPLILLFLFVAFLGDVYRDSLQNSLPEGFVIADRITEAFTAGWIVSSLLAVCSVTIAFTANLIMVQDKVTGRYSDLTVAPVAGSLLALGYFLSTALVTLLICYVALGAGLIYIAAVGWYLTVSDVFFALLDTLLLVLFGTALSSVVCHFLKSQGGITAVETIVSASYGFLCGAYMPISSLTDGLAAVIKLLPGTYGTALLHEHFMGGAIDAIGESISVDITGLTSGIRDGFDCTVSPFGNSVPQWGCYLIVVIAVLALAGVTVLLCSGVGKRKLKARI